MGLEEGDAVMGKLRLSAEFTRDDGVSRPFVVH